MEFVLHGYAVSLMPGETRRCFGDSLARFSDLATFLVKNEYDRNFKSRVCNINRMRDTAEYSRIFGEIVNFALQALLEIEEHTRQLTYSREKHCFELWRITTWTVYEYVWDIKLSCLIAIIWSATWDIISVFGFLRNLLCYAECGQRHCKLHQLKVFVHSWDFF